KLFLALDQRQKDRAAIYPYVPQEFFTRASRRVDIGTPSGLPASALSGDQRDILISLIQTYTSRTIDSIEASFLKKLDRDGIENIHFAWVGSEHRRQPHYYRIHGPSFYVEYDNTQDKANHIHSVCRDINSDFGFDVLASHYEHAHN
ncbi:MAG: DUF3500 domain-containing protein, partial [Chloroflexi bacterium]|nr:DUF3500 domain-containing protein [Chloroflexota bacterium]